MAPLDAFDADVLIYAAQPGHPVGERVRALFESAAVDGRPAGVGSVLLLPELLAKPLRDDASSEIDDLGQLLGLLHLRPVDEHTARTATVLAANYRLKAADAVHLATAIIAGADRFVTNNRRDFGRAIVEIDITYPDDLTP